MQLGGVEESSHVVNKRNVWKPQGGSQEVEEELEVGGEEDAGERTALLNPTRGAKGLF